MSLLLEKAFILNINRSLLLRLRNFSYNLFSFLNMRDWLRVLFYRSYSNILPMKFFNCPSPLSSRNRRYSRVTSRGWSSTRGSASEYSNLNVFSVLRSVRTISVSLIVNLPSFYLSLMTKIERVVWPLLSTPASTCLTVMSILMGPNHASAVPALSSSRL
jgi:hypothetical protein